MEAKELRSLSARVAAEDVGVGAALMDAAEVEAIGV